MFASSLLGGQSKPVETATNVLVWRELAVVRVDGDPSKFGAPSLFSTPSGRLTGQDDVRCERDQFCRVFAVAVGIALAPAKVNPQIAAVNPAQLLQDLPERRDACLTFSIVRGSVYEHTDPPHLLGLLRAYSERPCRRNANRTEKRPSPHIRPQAQETAW